jgi:hypothetical protein
LNRNLLAALIGMLLLAGIYVSIVTVRAILDRPLPPCELGSDWGRAWYGQRCIPYCPPDPKECG